MKLTVCIPVHNAAPFVERCARSLFSQTADDLEFIFIDDGSLDDGIAVIRRVLDAFPNRRAGARFLKHETALGAMRSRLVALSNASGELVTFCDADDWVDAEFYAKLIAPFADPEVDMAFAPMVRNENGPMRGVRNLAFEGAGYDYLDAADRVVAFNSMVNKVYRRSLFAEGVPSVPEGVKIGEDACFVAQVAARCRKVISVIGVDYHYTVNATSVSRTFDAARAVSDLHRVYATVDAIIPSEKAKPLRSQWIQEMLFLGLKFGVIDESEAGRLRKMHADLGVPWPDAGWCRKLVVALGPLPFALTRMVCWLLRLRKGGGI